jgi:hypothetical protein
MSKNREKFIALSRKYTHDKFTVVGRGVRPRDRGEYIRLEIHASGRNDKEVIDYAIECHGNFVFYKEMGNDFWVFGIRN